VPFAACYNASKYSGLSFWFKGDPAQAPWMKLSIVTPRTAEAAGGTCVQGVGVGNECYDHFSVNLFKVSNVWTKYTITWQQLAQYGWGQKVQITYRPETEIIGINFAPDWGSDAANKVFNKKFEFWVDNLSFDIAGPFTDTGFKLIVTPAQFNGAYAGRNMSFFGDPYTQLAAALEDPRFSRIGREGSTDDRKREIAALMAHIWQETGGLQFVTEVSPPSDYCRAADPLYPCVAGQTYIGRGPLQLSWNYNYGQAGEYLGVPTLLSNPAKSRPTRHSAGEVRCSSGWRGETRIRTRSWSVLTIASYTMDSSLDSSGQWCPRVRAHGTAAGLRSRRTSQATLHAVLQPARSHPRSELDLPGNVNSRR
jgi:hypothetical protein